MQALIAFDSIETFYHVLDPLLELVDLLLGDLFEKEGFEPMPVLWDFDDL